MNFYPIVAQAAPQQGGLSFLFLPLTIFVIFYLLILRPQQKQEKLRRKMLSELKRGDDVVTNAGIYGKVVELQDQTVSLQIATNVVIKMERAQINSLKAQTNGDIAKK